MRNPSSIENHGEMGSEPDRILVAKAEAQDAASLAGGASAPLRLATAIACYAMSLLVQFVLFGMWADTGLVTPGVFAAMWLLQGVWLDRKVRRRAIVERGNALTAVAIIAWPLYYGSLLGQFVLAKHS